MSKTPKRSRTSLGGAVSSGPLKTPRKVLELMQDGGKRHSNLEKFKILQAINACIVTAANSSDSEEEAYEILEDLVELDINLNESDNGILDKIGGPPLHLAAKLNVPQAVKLLCQNGASVAFKWESKNPIQVAMEQDADESLQAIFTHIANLERLCAN